MSIKRWQITVGVRFVTNDYNSIDKHFENKENR